MKRNKKGFTLIELLAVIVILAVVMLIAATAVIPMMTKSRKNSLLDEGIALEKAAKLAYQDPTADNALGGNVICIPLTGTNGLYAKGFYEKGDGNDGYKGSVLITPASNSTSFTYKVWITNGTYAYSGITTSSATYSAADDYSSSASYENCGGAGTTITWK